MDKDTRVRLTIQSDAIEQYGQNVHLLSGNGYSDWDETPYWHPGSSADTASCELDLKAGRTYYVMDRIDGKPFTITNVEVL